MHLPTDLSELGHHNILEIGDTKFLEYFSERDVHKRHVTSTQYVLSFVINGTKIISTREGTMLAHQNECLLIAKGKSIMSERIPDDDQPYQNLLFFLSDDFITRFQHKYASLLHASGKEQPARTIAKTQIDSIVGNFLISALMIVNNKALHSKNILYLKIEELLLYLLNSSHSADFKRLLVKTFEEKSLTFQSVILNNLDYHYDLEDYAHLAAMSLSSFKRKFKQSFGVSAGKWLRMQRLERAKSLLITSERTIADIANEVGYENSSHFIRAFKNEYGQTPHAFRLAGLNA